MLILLLLVLATGILAYQVFIRRPKGFPPGPRGVPILGYYPFINRDHHYAIVERLTKTYGPVLGMYLGNFRVVFVNGWENVREAFGNDDIIGRPNVCLLRDRFEGKHLGLVFIDGDFWRTQRRFTLHQFRNLGFGKRSHAAVVMEEVEVLLSELKEVEGPFSLEDFVFSTEINIIWSLLGGKRFPRKSAKLQRLVRLYRAAMSEVRLLGNFSVAVPALRFVFPEMTGYKTVTENCREIRQFFKDSIEEHKLEKALEVPNDFIGIYLKELRNNNIRFSFSEEQLVALCTDLIGATADTSTAVILFGVLFLCHNPEIQRKMQAEIDAVVGPDRLPTVEDRPRLSYVDAFVMEVLRLRTPAPIVIPHRALRDTTIKSYVIPKDTMVMINVRSVLMDPEYWADPEIFRPERFLTKEGKCRKDERFIPFGKGKRSCLGESLAKMTIFLTLAGLCHRYHFQLPSEDALPDLRGFLGFTLNAPPFRVLAIPRQSWTVSAKSN